MGENPDKEIVIKKRTISDRLRYIAEGLSKPDSNVAAMVMCLGLTAEEVETMTCKNCLKEYQKGIEGGKDWVRNHEIKPMRDKIQKWREKEIPVTKKLFQTDDVRNRAITKVKVYDRFLKLLKGLEDGR